MITDDVGYGDIGSYGATDIKTPNIDRLAKEGVRLTDFYAAPQCTPTRAALISGRYQQRVGLERAIGSVGPALEIGLPATGRSLPQLLKNNGYRTGLVGKWHLGYKPEFGPNAHGFDYFFGFLSGYIDFYTHTRGGDGQSDLYENTTPIKRGRLHDRPHHRARAPLHRAEEPPSRSSWKSPTTRPTGHSSRPIIPRRPRTTPPSKVRATPCRRPAKTTRRCSSAPTPASGRSCRSWTALGLTNNTLVIFTNDNGGEWLSRNAPLFHRKDTLWEGGIRVPAIFRWPGRIPAGKTSAQAGITMDLTASILAATNTPVPADARLEGINLLPIFEGRAPVIDRTLFWRIDVRDSAAARGQERRVEAPARRR